MKKYIQLNLRKYLKYKYLLKAANLNRYNLRVLNFRRSKYRLVAGPLVGRYKFKKRKVLSDIQYKKSFLFRQSFEYASKVIDSFPICVKTNEFQNHPKYKGGARHAFRQRYKNYVTLNLIFRLTFGKRIQKKTLPSRFFSRWNLIQQNFLSNFYNVSSILPTLNYFKTLPEVKHKLLFNKKGKILLNGNKKITNNRAETLKLGDVIEFNGSLNNGYDVVKNRGSKRKFIKSNKRRDFRDYLKLYKKKKSKKESFKNIIRQYKKYKRDKKNIIRHQKNILRHQKILLSKNLKYKKLKKTLKYIIRSKQRSEKKRIKKRRKKTKIKKSINKLFTFDLLLLKRKINQKKGTYIKKIKKNFVNRSSSLSFMEYDNYAEQVIICKKLKELSRSDAILMNPASKNLLSVNFLKKQ